jgi:hypothetical protein
MRLLVFAVVFVAVAFACECDQSYCTKKGDPCGANGCWRNSTQCETQKKKAEEFIYCANDDVGWANKTGELFGTCLQANCYDSISGHTNSSCVKMGCGPFWAASNRCIANDCSFAISAAGSNFQNTCPFPWIYYEGGVIPDTNDTRQCDTLKPKSRCTLFTCAIMSGGPFRGCWKAEND